jgi:hypothetical protein
MTPPESDQTRPIQTQCVEKKEIRLMITDQ